MADSRSLIPAEQIERAIVMSAATVVQRNEQFGWSRRPEKAIRTNLEGLAWGT